MARTAKRIGKREVDALEIGEVVWDGSLPGFGIRRQTGPVVSYVLKYRGPDGRQKWRTIGRHGTIGPDGTPWTPDTARTEAKILLGDIARGEEPGTRRLKGLTVAQLCDRYMEAAQAGRVLAKNHAPKRTSTLAVDEGRIARHIKPALGNLIASAVSSRDVERLLHIVAEGKTAIEAKSEKPRGRIRVTGGRTAANRAVGLLGGIFSFAIREGVCDANPVRGVMKFADQKRERRLSEEEYNALGKALREAKDMWPAAVGATRFLLLSGWRKSEVTGLRWEDVDLGRRTAFLGETKSGRSVRPLSAPLVELLKATSRTGDLVFPSSRGAGPMAGFKSYFAKLVASAGVTDDVTPHVTRHSFASTAADLGLSESTIACLIGHAQRTTTSRYVHGADDVLLASADRVAAHIDRILQRIGERSIGV